MAEERRLFYVGMTRAIERLRISWTRWRWTWGLWCAYLLRTPTAVVNPKPTTSSDRWLLSSRPQNAHVDAHLDKGHAYIPHDALQLASDTCHTRNSRCSG